MRSFRKDRKIHVVHSDHFATSPHQRTMIQRYAAAAWLDVRGRRS
jgi:hypothetical protein